MKHSPEYQLFDAAHIRLLLKDSSSKIYAKVPGRRALERIIGARRWTKDYQRIQVQLASTGRWEVADAVYIDKLPE